MQAPKEELNARSRGPVSGGGMVKIKINYESADILSVLNKPDTDDPDDIGNTVKITLASVNEAIKLVDDFKLTSELNRSYRAALRSPEDSFLKRGCMNNVRIYRSYREY